MVQVKPERRYHNKLMQKKNKFNNKSRQSEIVVGNIPSRSILNSQLAFQTKTLKSSKFSLFLIESIVLLNHRFPKYRAWCYVDPAEKVINISSNWTTTVHAKYKKKVQILRSIY